MATRLARAAAVVAAVVAAAGLVVGGAGCDRTPTAASPKEFTPMTKEKPGLGGGGGVDRKTGRGKAAPADPQ